MFYYNFKKYFNCELSEISEIPKKNSFSGKRSLLQVAMAQPEPPALRAQPFAWKNCGGSAILIRNLTLTPSPVPIPGNVAYGLTLQFNEDVGAGGEKVKVSDTILFLFLRQILRMILPIFDEGFINLGLSLEMRFKDSL